MLSIRKFFQQDEVAGWAEGIYPIVITHKLDGLALELTYKAGQLSQAVTRGDGEEGQDVTDNVYYIENIPKVIPDYDGTVRGEVVLPFAELERINKSREDSGEELYANCRNLATSSVVATDEEKSTKNHKCMFVAYDISRHVDYEVKLSMLTGYGFEIPHYAKVRDKKELVEWTDDLMRSRKECPYDTDGLVYRIDSQQVFDDAGVTGHHPRGVACLKPEKTLKLTVLESISWEVSRLSILTPVAHTVPVDLDGARCSKFNVGSVQMLRKMNLVPGDEVLVTRQGQVIPQIVANVSRSIINDNLVEADEVADYMRVMDVKPSQDVEVPTVCPHCGAEAGLDENQVRLHCRRDPECMGSTARRFDYFCKKLGIRYAAVGFAEKFLAAHPSFGMGDLMNISKFPTMGIQANLIRVHRECQRVLVDLKNGRIPAWKILHGLGPENVGGTRIKQIFEQLAQQNKQLKDVDEAWYKENIPACGDIYARILASNIDEKMINEYENICHIWGVDPYLTTDKKTDQESRGVFCCTGTLSCTRNEFVEKMEKKGFTFNKSVTKKLDFLVAGADCGSKLAKAQKYGIQILSEQEAEAL